LAAPPLLGFELANVCLTKTRRHPEQRQALHAAFRLRTRLAVEEVAINHDDALALATETGSTTYGASYLWLARRLGAELVTLDRPLAKAARAATAR
jgi:predicted nucleic acid-binding protein